MTKSLSLSLIAVMALYGGEQQLACRSLDRNVSECTAVSREVRLLARTIDYRDDSVTASDDAVAIGKGYFLKADKLVYRKGEGTIEAFGEINLLKGAGSYLLSTYAKLDLQTRHDHFDNLFYRDENTSVWTQACSAESSPEEYLLNGAMTSSCNPSSPDWTIRYSSGSYDKESKFLSLYNARIYAGSTPVMYLPYFAFPADKRRRTGLLIPQFGYMQNQGLIYQQPYYIAPQSEWDLELIPQIRTTRGYGMNGVFRFADSPYSKGTVNGGFFRDSGAYQRSAWERDNYLDSSPARHQSHYGYEINYQRSKLFAPRFDGLDDGMLIDYRTMNDVDYFNLRSLDMIRNYSRLLISRANYYATRDQYYGGVYMKYFEDLTKSSNSDTLQTLPSVQLHRFVDTVAIPNVYYSADYRYSHYDRSTGVNADQHTVFIPVSWHGTFWDDYVHAVVSENVFGSVSAFSQTSGSNVNDYKAYGHYQKADVFTNLVKPYDSFLHGIRLSLSYTKPSQFIERGATTIPSDMNNTVAYNQQNETLRFALTQNFFGYDGKAIVTHRLSQVVRYDGGSRYADTENELIFSPAPGWSVVSDTLYSHERSRLTGQLTTVVYRNDDLQTSLSHVYKDNAGTIDLNTTNYISWQASYALSQNYRLRADYEYDITGGISRRKGIGVSMTKACWSYDLAYREENILGSPDLRKVIYLQVRLIPFGGLDQKYLIGNH